MTENFPEYEDFDAVGLASLVRDKEITPSELIEAAIDRTLRRNPKLNAIIRTEFDRALSTAENVDRSRPFAGVPFLLKDLAMEEGRQSTFGSVFFRDYVASTTSELTRRMLESGLISIGRSNTPEFGLLPITEPLLHGATANPWSLAHSPGGSSGGSAAAVAAGIVPMAHGSDGGGSIRIPAANCGIFGLKAARGRLPQQPPGVTDYLSVGGVVSRSVRDTAAFLDTAAGAAPAARYWLQPPQRPFQEAILSDPGVLRIAAVTTDFDGGSLHPDCAAAVQTTAELLQQLGHTVELVAPNFEVAGVTNAFLVVWEAYTETALQLVLTEASTSHAVRLLQRTLGDWRTLRTVARFDQRRSGLESFEPFTWRLTDRSRRRTPAQLALAEVELQRAAHELAMFMGGYDALLTPTMGLPPILTGELDQTDDFDKFEALIARYVPFTPSANFTGRPAMSVPLYWNNNGLPIGSHFMGGIGDEFTLLSLAAQLERAQPWHKRRPWLTD